MDARNELKGKRGLVRLLNATRYSLAGYKAAWQDEEAFRQICLLAVIGLPGLPGLHEPGPQAGGRRTRTVARAHGQQAALRAFHEFVHQHTGQGRAGGGHQLRLRIGGVHGQAAHEVGRGGRGQGDLAMGTGDAAPEPG